MARRYEALSAQGLGPLARLDQGPVHKIPASGSASLPTQDRVVTSLGNGAGKHRRPACSLPPERAAHGGHNLELLTLPGRGGGGGMDLVDLWALPAGTSVDLGAQHCHSEAMTDEQFQSLSRSVGNLATAVGKMHADLTDVKTTVADLKTTVAGLERTVAGLKTTVAGLKTTVTGLETTVHEEVIPFLRRIDGRLAAVEARWANIEGRLATSEMRQATLEQIVYKRGDEPSS